MTDRGMPTSNLMIGLALIGLGGFFLLGQSLGIGPGRLWPITILLPGLLLFVGMAMDGQTAGWLAVPGSVLTVLGAILLYQSLSGHWESWAYAWSLVMPTAIGVGLVMQGSRNGERYVLESGVRLIRTGLLLFVATAVYCEVILNLSGFRAARITALAWPALLIAAGVVLLFGHGSLWYHDRGARRTASQAEAPHREHRGE